MAKSERKSKWKRKFRAIKRDKNKKKELLILTQILSKENKDQATKDSTEMNLEEQKNEDESMQINDVKVYNSKTKRDKNGNYPPWMNQRAIRKVKNNNKKRLKSKSK